jgi:hypothetical protein
MHDHRHEWVERLQWVNDNSVCKAAFIYRPEDSKLSWNLQYWLLRELQKEEEEEKKKKNLILTVSLLPWLNYGHNPTSFHDNQCEQSAVYLHPVLLIVHFNFLSRSCEMG